MCIAGRQSGIGHHEHADRIVLDWLGDGCLFGLVEQAVLELPAAGGEALELRDKKQLLELFDASGQLMVARFQLADNGIYAFR